MATLKLILDQNYEKTSVKEEEITFPLVIRLSHRRKWKNIKMGYSLKENEWDDQEKRVNRSFQNAGRANARISRKWTIALEVVDDLKLKLKQMDVYQIADVIDSKIAIEFEEKVTPIYGHQPQGTTLKDYGNKVAKRYRTAKRYPYADAFDDAVTAMLQFHGSNDLLLSEIDETYLDEMEAYWLGKGNRLGGLGVHLRQIRRIFNLAIKDKSTELKMEDYPFGTFGYSIKKGRPNKRAVGLDVIEQLRQYPYEEESPLWHHRNYWLFMFNLRGMNFKDLAFLRVKNCQNGRVRYERLKTRRGDNVRKFNIKVTSEARAILDYYTKGKQSGDLVFPIMEDVIDSGDDELVHKKYCTRMRNHDRRLKTISSDIGLEDKKLTSYVARHSFATAALSKRVAKTDISMLMGHSNAVITEAYLDELEEENKILDHAADLVFE